MSIENNYEYNIKKAYGTLRNSEKKVADYVLNNRFEVSNMTLKEIALKIGVSTHTIIRFVQGAGYKSFKDFKISLARDTGSEEKSDESGYFLDLHVQKGDFFEDIPNKIIGLSIKALEDTLKLVNIEDYKKAIKYVTESNIIDIYGVGNSGSIANDFMNKLTRVGLNCRAFYDNHLQQIGACHLSKKDLAIAISHSGETKDTIDALKIAKASGAKTLVITNYKASIISKYADIALCTGDSETTFYSEAMTARIAKLAIIDILYMGVFLSNYNKYASRLDKINNMTKAKVY